MKPRVRVYTDYKSPYAYVANKPLFDLEKSHDIELEWLPYTLRIAEYLGSVDDRSPHYWRKVRYAYMDARRYANEQGLVLKGPNKSTTRPMRARACCSRSATGFSAPTMTECLRCSGPTSSISMCSIR